MSYFKSKYRIVEVQSNDGNTYYIPERRDFLFYKSIIPKHDPGYTRRSSAVQAVITDQEVSRTHDYLDDSYDQ